MRKLLAIITLTLLTFSCGDSAGDVTPSGYSNKSTSSNGVGGSTARFNITGNFLYLVNDSELKAIDISNVEDPKVASTTNLGIGIETIFGYKNNLFIGGQSGMQIYGINQDGSPSYVSDYSHTTACDPVIANDNFAYVTIRSGLTCTNDFFDVNQLITLDISDITRPYDVDHDQMINPRGLAFFNGDLFVGEGESGLKRFSLANPSNPELIEYYDNIAANDMIALDKTLIITRDEGIFQFGIEEDTLLLYSPLK